MKNNKLAHLTALLGNKLSRNPLTMTLFLALCLNILFAPSLYGATGEAIPRSVVYAIGILLLATISLSIYLFFVIFQPERF